MKTCLPFVMLLILTPAEANAEGYMATIFINNAPQQQSLAIETGLAAAPDQLCQNIPSGQCCETPPSPPSAPTPPEPDISAGYLAFAVNGVGIGELNPPATGRSYGTLLSLYGEGWKGGVQWHPGDVIRIRGSGGAIAAFDGTITLPQDLSGIRPALIVPPTSRLVYRPFPFPPQPVQRTRIPLNHPIEIFWSPEAGNTLDTVRVDMTDFTHEDLVVSCVAPDQAGHLLVQVPGPAPFAAGDKGALIITRNRFATPAKPSANATIVFHASYLMGGSVLFVEH